MRRSAAFGRQDELMLELLEERHFQAIYDSAIWVDSIQELHVLFLGLDHSSGEQRVWLPFPAKVWLFG